MKTQKTKKEINKEIGFRLKSLRILKGLTLNDVCLHAGVTYQQYQNYEKGVHNIPIYRLVNIANLYGIEPSMFLDTIWPLNLNNLLKNKQKS